MTTRTRARANTAQVQLQLRRDILSGAFEPGQKLKFADLGERYGASVSVIREALSRLDEQGLVVAELNLGFRVMPLTLADLDDLTATRIDLETLALREAIARADLEWESELVSVHHRLARTPLLTDDDHPRVSDEWEQAHIGFHRALLAGCARPRLLAVTESLRDAADLYRRWSQIQEPDRDVAGEHLRILEAALDRDVDAAATALAEHYGRTADILRAHLNGVTPR